MYLVLLCSTLGKDWYSSASAVAVMVKIPVLSSNEKQRQKLKLKHGLPGFQFQPVKSPIISITRQYQGVTAEYLCTECGWCRYRWSPAWTLERIMWGLVTRAQWSQQWSHHNIIIGCHQTPHLRNTQQHWPPSREWVASPESYFIFIVHWNWNIILSHFIYIWCLRRRHRKED